MTISTLAIERSSFFALLGPSGCGKTTTLRMIGGFEDPTAGRVELGGADVTDVPPYKRDVNTVFQSYALFPHLDRRAERRLRPGAQEVRGPRRARGSAQALELVQLQGLERRRPPALRRPAAARRPRARARQRPRALLLDEPLGALDLKLRSSCRSAQRIQREVGVTFVHVTHDQEEAMSMADLIAVMNEGRIEQLGPPAELYERPRTEFVASFLGVSNLLDGKRGAAATARSPSSRPPTAPRLHVPAARLDGLADGARAGRRAPREDRAAPRSTVLRTATRPTPCAGT